MKLVSKLFCCLLVCLLVQGCADLRKANLAYKNKDYALAEKHWRELADHGFPQAYVGLGKIAEVSSDEQKIAQASEYFKTAYDLGYEPAAFYIGRYYYNHYKNQEELDLAKQWILKAVEQGNQQAYLLYAEMLFYGKGENQDIPKALKLYQDMAENGNAGASRALAQIYEKGINVEKDQALALNYYRRAFDLGNIDSELDIARFYVNGSVVKRDFDKAESIFLRFAENNHAKAAYLLGDLYQRRFILEGKDYAEQSAHWFQVSAENGYIPAKMLLIKKRLETNPNAIESISEDLTVLSNQQVGEASYLLARLINKAKISRSEQDELKYYLLAYKQGYQVAAYRIGEFYFIHQKNDGDLKKSREWMQKALAVKTVKGRLIRAELTLNGHGLTQDILAAITQYKTLSDEGVSKASEALAEILEEGVYTDKNLALALRYYQLAVRQGSLTAEMEIARYYANGVGVERDLPKAIHIFQHYAEAGNHKAAYLLAMSLEQQALDAGRDIPKNALDWYQASAEQNDMDANLRLIDLLFEGRGFTQDVKQAKAELHALSKQGVPEASYRLGLLYSEGPMKNTLQALYFYQLAFLQGSQKTVAKLAGLYRRGYGLGDGAAIEHYTRAATIGRTEAAYLLGVMFESLQQTKKAVKWYEMAAATQQSDAQMALINLYRKAGNSELANKWLLESVRDGNGKALLSYGESLFYGRRMKADKIKGLSYVLMASHQKVKGAVAMSLKLMTALNNGKKIELAYRQSLLSVENARKVSPLPLLESLGGGGAVLNASPVDQ